MMIIPSNSVCDNSLLVYRIYFTMSNKGNNHLVNQSGAISWLLPSYTPPTIPYPPPTRQTFQDRGHDFELPRRSLNLHNRSFVINSLFKFIAFNYVCIYVCPGWPSVTAMVCTLGTEVREDTKQNSIKKLKSVKIKKKSRYLIIPCL